MNYCVMSCAMSGKFDMDPTPEELKMEEKW